MRILEWLRWFFRKRSYKKVGKEIKASALKRELRRRELEDSIREFIGEKRKKGRLTAYQAWQLGTKKFKSELQKERMTLVLSGAYLKVRSRVA
jgi:hypothetical protein